MLIRRQKGFNWLAGISTALLLTVSPAALPMARAQDRMDNKDDPDLKELKRRLNELEKQNEEMIKMLEWSQDQTGLLAPATCVPDFILRQIVRLIGLTAISEFPCHNIKLGSRCKDFEWHHTGPMSGLGSVWWTSPEILNKPPTPAEKKSKCLPDSTAGIKPSKSDPER